MNERLTPGERLGQALVRKDEFGLDVLTEVGRQRVTKYVTNIDADVYALKNLSEEMAATAIARLSRSAEGVRVIIAREFLDANGEVNEDKIREVSNRIVNIFGDDSVKQVGGGIKVVVENASNLLTKYIEWGRLGGYIEQSTRYIFFDRRGPDGKFRYHMPETFDPGVRSEFGRYANGVFESYSEIVRGTTEYVRATRTKPDDLKDPEWKNVTRAQACDAARLLLPVATRAIVGITGSAHFYDNMAINLLGSNNTEARQAGERILNEARKVAPVLLAKTDDPQKGAAISAYKAETRDTMRLIAPSAEFEPKQLKSQAELIDYSPKHELQLLPHMLYRFSNMSLLELERELGNWSEDELLNAFKSYMGGRTNRRHRPDRAIEIAQYVWDVVCDYGIFRDLQRHRIVDGLEWQDLHPYFGYEIPQLLIDAGYEDQSHRIFESSLQNYELLQTRGYTDESQYSTLLGHKMRWKWGFNAREAFHLLELRTQPAGHPGYIKLCQQMFEKVREVHPNLAEAMIFINTTGETEELTRLGEARANQRRMALLGESAIDFDSSDN
ncbi:MAG TPA: FAD-dependent thymidylate synthase [Candidatus Saccharimonadales bacterium]